MIRKILLGVGVAFLALIAVLVVRTLNYGGVPDTVQQVESQLIMRHYDGFMRKTRIRGRRG